MANGTVVTAAPRIHTNGREISPQIYDELIEMRVSKSTGSVAHTSLRFNRAAVVGPTFSVGAPLDIDVLDAAGKPTTVFLGDIVSVGIDVVAGRSELTVGALDLAYQLGQQVVNESHMNMSPKSLIQQMASRAGLASDVDSSMSATVEHIQQAATPHVFLTQLADAYGCEWFVDGSKLVVKRRDKGGSPVKLSGNEDLRTFSARFSTAEGSDKVEVRGWDPATADVINSEVTPTGDTSLTKVQAFDRGRADAKSKRHGVSWPRGAVSKQDAEELAKGIDARMEAAMLTGRGEVDVDARLKPGVCIDVTDVAPDWNGTYYLSEVEHLFGDRQPFVTRFRIGGLRPATLVDLFGSASESSSTRLANGVTIGTVTNIADPDGLNRVKITLPYLSDDNETDWARVVQLGAGQARGLHMMPEVGDEVLVAFEHGELQRPFVIGGLFNGRSKPANADAITGDEVVERSLTNRTGDAITMAESDKGDDHYIRVALAKDAALLFVGEQRIDLKAKDVPIEITTGEASILLKDGDITLKANNITLDAKQGVTVKGQKFEADAKTQAKVKAGAGLTLEGGMVDLKGSGITNIKGSMVNIN